MRHFEGVVRANPTVPHYAKMQISTQKRTGKKIPMDEANLPVQRDSIQSQLFMPINQANLSVIRIGFHCGKWGISLAGIWQRCVEVQGRKWVGKWIENVSEMAKISRKWPTLRIKLLGFESISQKWPNFSLKNEANWIKIESKMAKIGNKRVGIGINESKMTENVWNWPNFSQNESKMNQNWQ